MSTIWADTVDQARAAARDFVFAGLSDKEDLYGLYDCVYNYESVQVLYTLNYVQCLLLLFVSLTCKSFA